MEQMIKIEIEPKVAREIALALYAARRYYWEQGTPAGHELGDRAIQLAEIFEPMFKLTKGE